MDSKLDKKPNISCEKQNESAIFMTVPDKKSRIEPLEPDEDAINSSSSSAVKHDHNQKGLVLLGEKRGFQVKVVLRPTDEENARCKGIHFRISQIYFNIS